MLLRMLKVLGLIALLVFCSALQANVRTTITTPVQTFGSGRFICSPQFGSIRCPQNATSIGNVSLPLTYPYDDGNGVRNYPVLSVRITPTLNIISVNQGRPRVGINQRVFIQRNGCNTAAGGIIDLGTSSYAVADSSFAYPTTFVTFGPLISTSVCFIATGSVLGVVEPTSRADVTFTVTGTFAIELDTTPSPTSVPPSPQTGITATVPLPFWSLTFLSIGLAWVFYKKR